MDILSALNPQQKEAVVNTDGPVLILAGAGSGKTRVLTHKVAYLLQQSLAQPWEILAVTFTNKAAGEMRGRIEKLIGTELGHMWVGTFHALFARIMRRFGDRLGYNTNFAIYDREDQEKVMREILKEFLDSPSVKLIRRMVRRVSDLKSRLHEPDPKNYISEAAANMEDIYNKYNARLKSYNALDFDDLLLKPLQLLTRNEDIANIYCERFRYILVDEFQDTNIVQNELLKFLSRRYRNITVVGDDDQSIYGWRGAELKNILRFEHDHPGAKVFRLEQNYRSTDAILKAAQAVIDHNFNRHPKTLWTQKKSTVKPFLLQGTNPRDEASLITERIRELIASGVKPSEIAILYRINAQSRQIEMALRENNLPYTIVGGLKFYQRKEIKDVLAYLRLVVNPDDVVSLMRIINFPPRGIGAVTLEKLTGYAAERSSGILDAMDKIEEIETIKSGAGAKITAFKKKLDEILLTAKEKSFPELVQYILDKSKMMDYYLLEGSEESFARMQNLKEFKTAAEEYTKHNPDRTIDDFLQEVALVTDIDEWEQADLVSLMTLHSAKGLEFSAVFLIGLQEGLFPLIRDGDSNIEEERRLFYVGATRAMENLFLTYANANANGMFCNPSQFLREIPLHLLEGKEMRRPKSTPLFSADIDSDYTPAFSDSFSSSIIGGVFSRGDLVYHSKFGEGTVSASEGTGDREKVMVYFQGYGAKKLLVKFAGLKKL